MKVEALETIKHHPHYLSAGDQITVDDELGQYFVDLGWCRNVETDEVGERIPGASTLKIDDSKIGVTDTGE